MKNLNFLLKAFVIFMAMLSGGLSAFAYDFEVDDIYYNITDENTKTIEVTYQGSSYGEFSNEYSGSVNIPSTVTYNGTTYSVTSIGSYAFYDCLGLSEVTIGNSVTSIGVSAFSGCLGVKELTIGNSVTEIGQFAFNMCSGLTSVTIPNSIMGIGENAFKDCNFESVISYCETPQTCGNRAFDGSYSARLSVPEGTKDAYANADEWEKFTNINENSGVDGVETEGNAIEVARYDIYGRQLNQPTKGINIIKMSDGTTRKEMVK